MNNLTEFQQKVLKALPFSMGHIHINKLVHKVYGDYVGWKRARGRRIAVIKALWKMKRLGLVDWRSFEYLESYAEYWYKKHPKWEE